VNPGRHRGRCGSITLTEAAMTAGISAPPASIFRQGDVLLSAGGRLSDAISRCGEHELSRTAGSPQAESGAACHRRRAGDAGSTPGPGQIIYSNGYALRALAAPRAPRPSIWHRRDTIEATRPHPRARDLGADILVTTAAPRSAITTWSRTRLRRGRRNRVLADRDAAGQPMMHGRLGAMRVVGVPGIRCPLSLHLAVRGAADFARCRAAKFVHHVRETACWGRDVGANDRREDYLRARLEERADGMLVATPVNHQDSSLLANLSAAGALVIRPRLRRPPAQARPATFSDYRFKAFAAAVRQN